MKSKSLSGMLKKGVKNLSYATLIAGTSLIYGKDSQNNENQNYSSFLKESNQSDYFFELEHKKGLENKMTGCLELDIVLLGDFSGSVRGYQGFIADAFESFVNRFELYESGVRVGIVMFNDNPIIVSKITTDKNQLLKEINTIRKSDVGNYTNINSGLVVAYNLLNESNRPKKMIIVISDGSPNVISEEYGENNLTPDVKIKTLNTAQSIKTDCMICGILIQSGSADEKFMMQMSNPECYVSSNYEMLASELENLDICF